MKVLFTALFALTSLSAFTASHFECYRVKAKMIEPRASRYLIPAEADLTSGGIFASLKDEKLDENFDYFKTTKKHILMNNKNGSFLRIDNKGLKRNLSIKKLGKDGVLRTRIYVCYEESSV